MKDDPIDWSDDVIDDEAAPETEAEKLERLLDESGTIRSKLAGRLSAEHRGEQLVERVGTSIKGLELEIDSAGFRAVIVEGAYVWTRGARGEQHLEELNVYTDEASGALAGVAVNGRIVFFRVASFELSDGDHESPPSP